MPIESEVYFDQAAVELQKEILSLPPNLPHTAPLTELDKLRGRLGPRGNGMENVHATDAPSTNERTESARDSFYFGEFRHAECNSLIAWRQPQRVPFHFGFGGIREGSVNRLAFKPVGELVAVMFAAGLTGLSAGNQNN